MFKYLLDHPSFSGMKLLLFWQILYHQQTITMVTTIRRAFSTSGTKDTHAIHLSVPFILVHPSHSNRFYIGELSDKPGRVRCIPFHAVSVWVHSYKFIPLQRIFLFSVYKSPVGLSQSRNILCSYHFVIIEIGGSTFISQMLKDFSCTEVHYLCVWCHCWTGRGQSVVSKGHNISAKLGVITEGNDVWQLVSTQ